MAARVLTLSGIEVTAVQDTTAPILSNVLIQNITSNGCAVRVTTDEIGGTLYSLVSQSATATATAVKAGNSQSVLFLGQQTINVSGLTAQTNYYVHLLHRDAAGNDSAVITSQGFQTAGASSRTLTLSGITVSQFAPLALNGFPSSIAESAPFSFDVTNAATAPTTGNTTVTLGGQSLTIVSVVGNTVTCSLGTLPLDYASHSVVIDVNGQSTTVSATLTPPPGYSVVTVTTPVTDDDGSVFYNYTTDAPAAGDYIVYGNTSLNLSVLGTGEWILPDGAPVNNATFSVFIKDGSTFEVGTAGVFTVDVGSVVIDQPTTGTPVLNGTAEVGQTLTYDLSSIDDPNGIQNIACQMMRGNTEIPGATSVVSYGVVAADAGNNLRLRVSVTDNNGVTTLLYSATVSVPLVNTPATGQPVIVGSGVAGEQLTVDVSSIADVDGFDPSFANYTWLINSTTVGTGPTYTPTVGQVGSSLRVAYSFVDNLGETETLTSAAVTITQLAPPVITGSASHSVQEGQAFNAIYTITNRDGQAPTLSGDDAALFSLANVSGDAYTLTMTPKSFDTPQDSNTDNAYSVTINIDDQTNPAVTFDVVVTVIEVAAVVTIPIKRAVEWDEDQTPQLVIGDTFWHLATLMQGVTPVAFNVSAATSIKVALISIDHTKAYTDSVEIQSNLSGASWADGVISLFVSGATTSQAAEYIKSETLAKIEIEVTISGNTFTWFAPVRVVPGYVH